MDKYLPGSPERFAFELRYLYSEFEGLTSDELDSVCLITLKIMMSEGDTTKRMYYGEARKFIKNGYKL